MREEPRLDRCPGCGDRLPAIDGAVHPYVGASSACWTRFAELSATLPRSPSRYRRLVTDAYMVQHPGVPERRAIQSVGAHLVALHLVLERGLPPEELSTTLQRLLERPPAWRWLEPPVPNGSMTMRAIAEAVGAGDEAGGQGHAAALDAAALDGVIEAYVRGVWDAWQGHRAVVVEWAKVQPHRRATIARP